MKTPLVPYHQDHPAKKRKTKGTQERAVVRRPAEFNQRHALDRRIKDNRAE